MPPPPLTIGVLVERNVENAKQMRAAHLHMTGRHTLHSLTSYLSWLARKVRSAATAGMRTPTVRRHRY
ncbi:MAG: hypothetical protein ACK5KM_11805 [Hyphomicrobiaceae bacterium]